MDGGLRTLDRVDRMRDVSRFLEQFVSWSADREDVHAVGLAGSWARGTATPDSDVDLVVIVEDVPSLINEDGWLTLFGDVASAANEDWGLVQSKRAHYVDGLEVEFGLTTSGWAAVPLDPGTSQVVADGFKVLYDPDGLLRRCVETRP